MAGNTMINPATMVVAQQQATVEANGSHQTSIYVLERDSKYVYEYNIAKKLVFRRQVNIQQAF